MIQQIDSRNMPQLQSSSRLSGNKIIVRMMNHTQTKSDCKISMEASLYFQVFYQGMCYCCAAQCFIQNRKSETLTYNLQLFSSPEPKAPGELIV